MVPLLFSLTFTFKTFELYLYLYYITIFRTFGLDAQNLYRFHGGKETFFDSGTLQKSLERKGKRTIGLYDDCNIEFLPDLAIIITYDIFHICTGKHCRSFFDSKTVCFGTLCFSYKSTLTEAVCGCVTVLRCCSKQVVFAFPFSSLFKRFEAFLIESLGRYKDVISKKRNRHMPVFRYTFTYSSGI